MSARSSLRVISTMKPSPILVGILASTGITPFASLARPPRPRGAVSQSYQPVDPV